MSFISLSSSENQGISSIFVASSKSHFFNLSILFFNGFKNLLITFSQILSKLNQDSISQSKANFILSF
jgi:hypothetical protein